MKEPSGGHRGPPLQSLCDCHGFIIYFVGAGPRACPNAMNMICEIIHVSRHKDIKKADTQVRPYKNIEIILCYM